MSIIQRLVGCVVLMGAAAAVSCGFDAGINVPRGSDTNDAQFSVEAEMIPNAVLVRQDTVPDWELGRHAFKPGGDRLLVVTQISTFSSTDIAGKPLVGRVETVERVWITIPASTAIGTVLDVEKLDSQFLTGYDIREVGQKEFFIQPCGLKGKIRLLQENAGTAVVDVNIVVAPKSAMAVTWRVKKVMEVPMTTTGIRASRLPADAPENTFHVKPSQAAVKINPTPTPSTDIDPVAASAQTQPAPPGAGATVVAAVPSTQPGERTVQGRWIMPRTPTDNFEYRFQFDADGTCVFTTQRPTYPAVPRYGTYQVKNNFLVINVERAEPGILKMPYLTLKVGWAGDCPVLEGELAPGENTKRRLLLKPASFADMNKELPPKE